MCAALETGPMNGADILDSALVPGEVESVKQNYRNCRRMTGVHPLKRDNRIDILNVDHCGRRMRNGIGMAVDGILVLGKRLNFW